MNSNYCYGEKKQEKFLSVTPVRFFTNRGSSSVHIFRATTRKSGIFERTQ